MKAARVRMPKLFKERSKLFALLSLFVVGSVFSIVNQLIYPDVASAITDAQKDYCVQHYGGSSGATVATAGGTNADWTDNKCAEICTTHSSDVTGITTSTGCDRNKVASETEAATTDDATKVLKDGYGDVAVKTLCGNDQTCALNTRTAVSQCIDSIIANGYDGSDGPVFPDMNTDSLASCMRGKGYSAANVAALRTAFAGAREDITKNAQTTLTASSKEECESTAGNTWNDDTSQCDVAKDKKTCAIDGVGWFVCPTMELMAQLNDAAYGFLASHFLSIDTKLVDGAKDSWAKFRDVANVLFVIAFLFVVYSQLTSVGITNYGIKKMLPKIVIAAILVNMSFIICQLAVDLSNILGYGLSQFFERVTVGTVVTGDSANASALGNNLTWVAAIGSILVVGTVGIALGISVPVIVSALLAIGLIVLILVARQALIILLITIAPVAFVAYLLPNTEQWYKKWVKMFSTLLLLFPIIGLVFGASKLAGNIILKGAEDDPLMQVVALGVSALPFFVVPGLLKGALNAAGAIGTKLSGMADARGKAAASAHKSKAEERRKNSYIGRQLAERSKLRATRNAMIAGGTYSGKNPFHKARSKVFGAVNNNRLSGKAGDRIGTAGDMLEAKEWKEDVDAAAATFSIDKQPEIVKMAQSGVDASGKKVTDAMRAAAIEYTSKKGSIGEVASIDSKGADAKVRSAHQEAIRAKGLNNIAGNEVLKEIGQGGVNGDDVNRLIRERVEKGSMLATDLTQSESSAALVAGAVGSGGSNLSAAGKAKLQETVDTIANNESTRKAMSVEMKKQVRNMGATYTEPPTTSPAGGAPSGGTPSGAGGSGPTGGSGSSGSGSGSGGTP